LNFSKRSDEDGSLLSVIFFLLWMVLCVSAVEGIAICAYSRFLDLDILWATVVVDLIVMGVLIACASAASLVVGVWRSALAAWFIFSVALVTAWMRFGLPGVSRPIAVLLAVSVGITTTRWVNSNRSVAIRYQKQTLPWIILVVLLMAVGVRSWEYRQEANRLHSLPPIDGNKPNILFIVVDTLRADHLSTYGYARDTSPNLSRVAGQGVIFDNAIAPASWTVPSHASMLTGLYPHDHRTANDNDILAEKWPTIGEVLSSEGYRTAAFSANVNNFNRKYGLARGFAHFEDYWGANYTAIFNRVLLGWRIQFWMRHFRNPRFVGRQRAEQINRRALGWIDREKRPFFVMLNYMDAHDPYLPPEPYRHAFTKEKNPGGVVSVLFDEVKMPDARALAGEVAAYDGGIRYVDDQIQNLLNELKKRGVLDNTIVVVTGDHGEAFGEHNLVGHKNSLYREAIHVPLIVWNPKTIPAGRHVRHPVSLVDIPRTLISLTDPAYHGSFPGRSLEELWVNSRAENEWPDPLSELAQVRSVPVFPNHYGPVRSVVGPEYQYISQKGGDLLYNWKNDPRELHDLSVAEPGICASMRAKANRELPLAASKKSE
jgi:arylsulfatase A-like enzyme